MLTYLIRRVLQSIPLLFGVSLLAFFIIRLTPGGPLMAFEDPKQTPADRQRLERALGLDQPLPIQYLKWLNATVQLDFGTELHPASAGDRHDRRAAAGDDPADRHVAGAWLRHRHTSRRARRHEARARCSITRSAC